MSGFEVYGASTSSTEGSKPKVDVDFNALNDYVIEEVNCKQPETLSGYISMIVDLGTQKQPDAEYDLDEKDKGKTAEQLTTEYEAELAHNFEGDAQYGKITKFDLSYDDKAKAKVLRKFVKQKPRQSIAYAVDFPDIQLNKGKFFGNDTGETQPLRLWAGGQFYNKFQKKILIQNLIPLKVKKDDKDRWTMAATSIPYKMAVAAKLIETGQPFVPQSVDKLLGRTFQFSIQVFNKEVEDKKYYTEKMKFIGALQRGSKEFEGVTTHLVQFNKENDPEAIKELRKHVINTIANATNFEGSAIQKQLKELRPFSLPKDGEDQEGDVTETQPEPTEAIGKKSKAKPAPAAIDEDLPF